MKGINQRENIKTLLERSRYLCARQESKSIQSVMYMHSINSKHTEQLISWNVSASKTACFEQSPDLLYLRLMSLEQESWNNGHCTRTVFCVKQNLYVLRQKWWHFVIHKKEVNWAPPVKDVIFPSLSKVIDMHSGDPSTFRPVGLNVDLKTFNVPVCVPLTLTVYHTLWKEEGISQTHERFICLLQRQIAFLTGLLTSRNSIPSSGRKLIWGWRVVRTCITLSCIPFDCFWWKEIWGTWGLWITE